ncbi:conserved domain protein [Coleofasciculus chthonoplastes PCC 7420]|uniref:Conserved domain protein n=1 Tax=Coleofasciculus chthonoplastes PCC 7420 TaxID=118168 RepID=B4VNE2_9CYAN|nr:DUF928 domain-containing protein [Coleofasciculus chthonoplastes]EDX76348.1 conserved domain protein [Coleofasciculus chthonoplastes PCC 7420]
MTKLKLATKVILPLVLVSILTNLLVFIPPTQAQSQRRSGLIAKIKRFFLGTRSGGTPTGRHRGGAVRDRCPNVDQPLTALVPATDAGIPFVEPTISERPSFWFYVPYFPRSQRNAEFVLIDENEDDVYATTFPLTQPSGIVSLQLPQTIPPLKEGEQYRWVFSVICNPANRSADATVNGWIERVPVNLALSNQLQTATDKALLFAYADQGLWYETLTLLAQLQRTHPQQQELQDDWQDLLQTIGLPETISPSWTTYSLPN